MFLVKIFQQIEKFLIRVRDVVWNYPEFIFFGRNSLTNAIEAFYFRARPVSHVLSSVLLIVLAFLLTLSNISAVLRINTDTLIEGVVVGQDENGDLLKVYAVNPLIVTNVQIKRDIAELVYEPLLRVDQQNQVHKVLADNIADIGAGKTYRIKLKEGVKWHDNYSEDLNADDVIATFNLLKELENEEQTSSVFSKAAKKIEVTKIDRYLVEFSIIDKTSVIPNFFELISFKIMPAHLIKDLKPGNIVYPDPLINNSPVGTGPFKVSNLNDDQVILLRNEDYDRNVPKLKKIIFRLYKDNQQAFDDLKSGQIHSLIGYNSDMIQESQAISNLKVFKSNVIFNQYWALYFNLSESGKAVLKDKKVRQAITSAINKQFLVDALVGAAVEAKGPIPETSFAYADVGKFTYDVAKANALLDEAGWALQPDGTRIKDGEVLELELVYVNNPDRAKVVELIKSDLEDVGVKVNLTGKTITEVNNDHLLPALFDIIIYGVSTFIDPDRYELFHSSRIGYPNLNIASYVSEEKTTAIKDGKKINPPEVDVALEKGRSLIEEDARTKSYLTFQEDIMDEMPVIFLYHPVYTYVFNKRVKGVVLENMTTLEDRFREVTNWYIEV